MSNRNGIVTKPVGVQDIQAVLGSTETRLSQLCLSSNINEKAVYKPTNIQSFSPISKEQRKAVNYSISVNTYDNPIQLVRAIMGALAWSYTRPSSCFRMLDFNGYDHNAKDWLTVTPAETSVSTNKSVSLEISGDGEAVIQGLESLLDILSLGYLSQYNELNFGFLLRIGAFTTSTTNCYYLPLTGAQSIRDIVDNGKISIPANTLSSAGTWHLIPCFTTAQYEQNKAVHLTSSYSVGDIWLPIPFTNIPTIQATSQPTGYPIDIYIRVELNNASASVDGLGMVTLSNVSLKVRNSGTSSYRIVVSSAKITSGVLGGAVNLQGGSATVSAGGSANLTIQSSQVRFEVADPSIERLSIDIEYYEDSNTSQRRSTTIYIEF